MKNKIILTTLSPKTHRTSEENLGIEYLKAALLKEGYDVRIIDAWLCDLEVDDVCDMILMEQDNLLFVAISSYMSNTAPSIELMKKMKEYNSDIKFVCGGFGPTFYPGDYLKNGADYIIRGEGEESICELAKCILEGKKPVDVKNVGYVENNKVILNEMHDLVENLDSIAFPSRDYLDTVLSRKSSVNMVSSRGCSGNCEFCSVVSFFRLSKGRVWRTRSIENIVDEIEMLYNKGVKYIKMVDDSFVDGIRDEAWCEKFADEIEKRNIKVKLRGQIRADKITDSILYNLRRAGFFSFACGIENGSQTALTRMNKSASLEDNERALQLFKKYNYIVQMGFILFDEKTTLKELEENYYFLKKYDFAVTKGIFSEMFSAEGTKLNNRLRKENKLLESNFLLNNNKYFIDDILVNKVYDGLKKWHKSHSIIYDMTIDPVTAPKAIGDQAMKSFYENIMHLKKIDLLLFRDLLLMIKENPYVDVDLFINNYIDNTSDEYKKINHKVKKLYKENDLVYNAVSNPFI